jgi:taurine dioxygenase
MQVRNLSPHTGAEVTGLNLTQKLSPAGKAELHQLLAERAVVVVRNQRLSPPQFMQAAEAFGELMPQMIERFTLPDFPLVGFISSEDTDKPGGKRMVRGEQFHTDHSNYPAPPKATLLHAVTIPSAGGDTQFVNVHASYEDLPQLMKQKIECRRALHVYLSSRSPRRKAVLSDEARARIPETWQPLVARHPDTGRKGLYLNTAHMERVEGLEDEEGFALIAELMRHATQPKYEYRHRWHDGDLLIWDNRSVMHQANADYTERRYLYRLMVKGVPLAS